MQGHPTIKLGLRCVNSGLASVKGPSRPASLGALPFLQGTPSLRLPEQRVEIRTETVEEKQKLDTAGAGQGLGTENQLPSNFTQKQQRHVDCM